MTQEHQEQRSGKDRRSEFEGCPKFNVCNLTEDQIEKIVKRVLLEHEETMQDRMFEKIESKGFEKIGRLFAAKFFIWIGIIVLTIFAILKHLKLIDN